VPAGTTTEPRVKFTTSYRSRLVGAGQVSVQVGTSSFLPGSSTTTPTPNGVRFHRGWCESTVLDALLGKGWFSWAGEKVHGIWPLYHHFRCASRLLLHVREIGPDCPSASSRPNPVLEVPPTKKKGPHLGGPSGVSSVHTQPWFLMKLVNPGIWNI